MNFIKIGLLILIAFVIELRQQINKSKMKKIASRSFLWMSKHRLELLLFVIFILICVVPYWITFVNKEYRGSGIVFAGLAILLLTVVLWPSYLSRLSYENSIKIYFKGRPYYENYDNRISTFLRAIRKLGLLWIILSFGLWSHFHVSKNKWENFKKMCDEDPEFKKGKSKCVNKYYHEQTYIQDKEQFLATLALAIAGIVLTAYWNLDSIYGRRWQYICGIYKDFILAEEKSDKKENLRINLCIDILDHAMWNSRQFKVFFLYELERYYWFLLKCKDTSLIKFMYTKKEGQSEEFKALCRFLGDFERELVKKQIRNEKIKYPIKLDFDSLRDGLSLLSEFIEFNGGLSENLNRYPGLDKSYQQDLDITRSIFKIENDS